MAAHDYGRRYLSWSAAQSLAAKCLQAGAALPPQRKTTTEQAAVSANTAKPAQAPAAQRDLRGTITNRNMSPDFKLQQT